MNWYFPSVPLAKWASENNFKVDGTPRLHHIGLPNEIETMEGQEEKSNTYLYQKYGDALLVSDAIKIIREKKHFCPSNKSFKCFCYEDEWKKPRVHTFYDHTKQGVDVVCLISSHQSTHFKSPRWPMNGLPVLLDTLWTNSKVLLAESPKPDVMSKFVVYFSSKKAACLPVIQHRFENSNNIQSSVMQKIERVLCIQSIHCPVRNVHESVGRCGICVTEIIDTREETW